MIAHTGQKDYKRTGDAEKEHTEADSLKPAYN